MVPGKGNTTLTNVCALTLSSQEHFADAFDNSNVTYPAKNKAITTTQSP